jgi:CheY-like chemotaxis protein
VDQQSPVPFAVGAPPGATDGRPHILVIDDEPLLLTLFARLLARDGFRVTTERFPLTPLADQVDRIRQLAPDLLLLDLVIGGGLHGWPLLQRLQDDPVTAGLPAVVCTAATRDARELGAELHARGVAVVRKPFAREVLLAAIRAALAAGPDPAPDRG